ncbi:hypothetical protein SJ05684_b41740 (plasmid) [Sinorhizobium sojae CCBAU 05684]|uniref:Uncharacterized protein n=1 Tax=Sinorhizobium sojae CCBAU 05684 TaxID=716928 RepID=A0A249PH89_9HYPH|nr:hypothetical protein SJ05684_b41740 [Sinorhizobium sojae CCBAU 05684]
MKENVDAVKHWAAHLQGGEVPSFDDVGLCLSELTTGAFAVNNRRAA